MASKNLEKWKLLFNQVEVLLEYTAGPSILNEAQLLDFESRASLILPEEFKEFCQVFGDGKFGSNMFFIEIPDIEDVKGQLISNEIILDSCKGSFSWSSEVKELLESAYLFGGGDNFVSFIFDLRTYSEQDKSYDIYGVACRAGLTRYLGRDFFEFVRDFCIGEQAKEVPELLVKVPPEFVEGDPLNNRLCFGKVFLVCPVFAEDIALLEEND